LLAPFRWWIFQWVGISLLFSSCFFFFQVGRLVAFCLLFPDPGPILTAPTCKKPSLAADWLLTFVPILQLPNLLLLFLADFSSQD
jgi:hypothetical protein